MAKSTYFVDPIASARPKSSVLPVLTGAGDFRAGSTSRLAVALALNPLAVLKARFEVHREISNVLPPAENSQE
jgi:hypothetical protein